MLTLNQALEAIFETTPSNMFLDSSSNTGSHVGERKLSEPETIFKYYFRENTETKAYKNFKPIIDQFNETLCSFRKFCCILKKSNISDNVKGGILLFFFKLFYVEVHKFFGDIQE